MEIIGLIPAGGTASRLGKIPCSKEVFPFVNKNGEITVTSSYLIKYYKIAGIQNIYFIIRNGKWDIPEYFADGSNEGVNIGYLLMRLPFGAPFTIDQAYTFVKDKYIAVGFPDIIFKPEDAFVHLKTKMLESKAEVVLAMVPCDEYQRVDMVEFDENGKIENIVIKENRPDLKYSWFIALWSPAFTFFMHNFLNDFLQKNPLGKIQVNGKERELYIGDVIHSAIKKGMHVEYVIFPDGRYMDLGIPSALFNTDL